MNGWTRTGTGLRIGDSDSDVEVRAPDWQPTDENWPGQEPVDGHAVGRTTGLSLPASVATVLDARTGETTRLDGAGRVRLDAGEYVFGASAVELVVGFERPAVLERGDSLHVDFEDRTRVAVGFRDGPRAPTDTVTIPKTLEGVATAITYAASAHRVTTPDRTARSMRRHPPEFEFGDAVDVPERVAAGTPETGIEFVVPRSLRSLFVAAPLAYYLGAEVSVESGATPRLRAPAAGVNHPFESLETDVPETLARVFWLDCLARTAGPRGERALAERSVLEDLEFDAATAYAASPAERLRTYLDLPFDRVADRFPEWHLSMHVAPNLDHVRALPFLLDRLAVVYPPETAELEKRELMERSLDDFYRGAPGPVATVEMLKPKDRPGRAQGWLADGTPIDVFKTLPEAYRNHLRYLGRPDEEMSVAVVLNDRSMAGEHDAVADIYRDRAESLPMDVTLYDGLTRSELADVFVDHHEFVHYVGHCEVSGLRCADGTLSISELPETNVETFFLNACGSYYEGLELVEKGSVAGAVTFRKVLDEQAAKVGTAFARLLVHGFPIETALRLARRRIRMGKDYAVVGDGMQTLSRTDAENALVAHVTSRPEDYHVSWEQLSGDGHGGSYDVAADGVDSPRLCGNRTEFAGSAADLAACFDGADHPVIVDGTFYWADEAAALLGDKNRTGESR
ncbi:hypothetical protein [Halobacterium wangiae]|uniref:hypothetical protein n=1 Tax=Halobacterium wangiae TaxID=2902623 RepID=UPI001E6492A7|nr:hypothetical protein [Halobacterium wangiae]